ncbi:hypothetical protein QVM88_05070 [Providencia stuartii]|nr:hypothetical protein [Providencia stuartii]MDN0005783.1 hypothetical protein [Providencia stuartii]
MNWKNEVKAWLLMSTGLGTILLLMGSTFYVVITQSFGLFNMTGESEFSLAFWANIIGDSVLLSALYYTVKVSVLGAFGAVLLSYPIAL